jgi:hypothetical protein
MRRAHSWRWLLLAALQCGCPDAPVVRPPPPPASLVPPPPLPHVPAGCEQNLAGLYAHRDDGTFRYLVTDDGLNLHVHAFRQYGSTAVELASGGAIDLRRTATGIHGEARASMRNRLQKDCPVVFPYELTACAPEQLTLRAVQQLSLTDDCQVENALQLNLIENVLDRMPMPDAGGVAAADAGVSLDGGAEDGGTPSVDAGSVSNAPPTSRDAG